MSRAEIDRMVGEIRDLAGALGGAKLMEVCGTHTVSLFRSGVKSLLPDNIDLLSGPGCPVCVTSQGYIDAACTLAARPNVIICTYGDMVRVPGRGGSLETHRADGADVRIVYSTRDALRIAERHPDREVVFLAVGFETTAPATAAAVLEARRLGIANFSVLTAHKLVVPAMEILLSGGDTAIDGFLCPGHVSVVIGAEAYRPVVDNHGKPCVVAGFEPPNMIAGILALLRQVHAGVARLENVYAVAVSAAGNPTAVAMLEQVFEVAPAVWRAMGELPGSGLKLAPAYAAYDAQQRFGIVEGPDYDPPGCRCGEVIQGKAKPAECDLFGTSCTPLDPIGPCMVSSEGTCAAWYKYNRVAVAAR